MTVSCENSAPYCSFFIVVGYVISGIGFAVVLFNDKSAFAIISLVRGVVYADVVGICSRCGKWSIWVLKTLPKNSELCGFFI